MQVWRAVVGFLRFWYDFVFGDDWTVAVSIAAALLVTALLNRNGVVSWWVMPLTVVVVTWNSLRRWAKKNVAGLSEQTGGASTPVDARSPNA
jgi:hypothetical protein